MEIKDSESVDNLWLPTSMKPSQTVQDIPFELCAAAGIALALSGQFPVAIVALVLWLVLRRIKPEAPSTIALVTSIQLSTAVLACLAVAMGMAPLSVVVEVAAVSIIALLLFFNGTPAWAYVIIVHSTYVAVHRALNLRESDLTTVQQRTLVGSIAVQVLIIWMLIAYLRPSKQESQQ